MYAIEPSPTPSLGPTSRAHPASLGTTRQVDSLSGEKRRLEAQADELIGEQRERLKAEAALQARLADAAHAEAQLQARGWSTRPNRLPAFNVGS